MTANAFKENPMLTIKTSLAVILMTLSVFVSSAVTYLVMHSSALAVTTEQSAAVMDCPPPAPAVTCPKPSPAVSCPQPARRQFKSLNIPTDDGESF
jgi:hypothetical protein